MYNASPIFASDVLGGSGMFRGFPLMVKNEVRANQLKASHLSENVRTGPFPRHSHFGRGCAP